MSDDLVIRLRESDGYMPLSPTDSVRGLTVDTALMKEAADEIERLRKELEESESYAHSLWEERHQSGGAW